jgi:hypothetical protein
MAFDITSAYAIVQTPDGKKYFLQSATYYESFTPYATVSALPPFGSPVFATMTPLSAAQIASPSAGILANLQTTYYLNVAPYTRYQSDGSALVEIGAGGGGSGTVTATGGDLTSNALVLGAGTTDSKVVAGITSDGTSKITLGVAGTSVGSVDFKNATSGTGTLQPPAGALGTITWTLPGVTSTLATLAGTETFTNKTLTAPTLGGLITSDGATLTTANAMGALAIDTTKGLNTKSIVADSTFTFSATPATNTWFSLALTNSDTAAHIATIPSSTPEASSVAITTVNVPASSTIVLTWRYVGGSAYQVFGAGIPPGTTVTNKSAAYTVVAGDANTIICHPTSDNNARTFTIDSNANVPYEVGTALTFINMMNTVTIAITSDTMTLAGSGSTGSRTLAVNGMATAVKLSATTWLINGTGLT